MYRAQLWSWDNYWIKEVLEPIELKRIEELGLDIREANPVDPNRGTRLGDRSNVNVTGNAGDDTIYGEGGHDRISGLIGNDILNGGYGAETLYGNEGADTIHGGRGFDNDSILTLAMINFF
ncbi:MAG: hypothetical protein GDA56_30550 [Hormoscilla sp. GM7CHS1pb]|nr:hypothetical protein [Hormoscilla sp. GM7CHS1pb]